MRQVTAFVTRMVVGKEPFARKTSMSARLHFGRAGQSRLLIGAKTGGSVLTQKEATNVVAPMATRELTVTRV